MTWVIVIWSSLCLIWMISATSSRPSKDCATDPAVTSGALSLDACQAASDVGTGIGVVIVGFLWFFVFFVLSIIWFMSRPRRQEVVIVSQVPQS
jgi:hypothetical protein